MAFRHAIPHKHYSDWKKRQSRRFLRLAISVANQIIEVRGFSMTKGTLLRKHASPTLTVDFIVLMPFTIFHRSLS